MDKYYLEDDVIVSFSIMDKRWNNNESMWDDLLKSLLKNK